MRTFVYFVGGSGARTLRSLIFLMASGVDLGKGNEIVPILVDYDIENGDLVRTKALMDQYVQFNKIIKDIPGEEKDHLFFNGALTMLGNNPADSSLSFVEMGGEFPNATFGNYINYDNLNQSDDDPTQDFIRSLYSASKVKSKQELELSLKLGFKGNPNIGSVVFNKFFGTETYRTFYNSFSTDETTPDKVFIVGSIFGGTGSTGIPQLVKNLRSCEKNAIRNCRIGTCIILPYFNVEGNEKSQINSNLNVSKSKAALSYYQKEVNDKLDEIYYIGCNARKGTYKNVEGGSEQRNKAHLVELLSAMSIVEFAKHPGTPHAPGILSEYEYGSAQGFEPDGCMLDVLSAVNVSNETGTNEVYNRYVRPMNAFAFFKKYCDEYVYTPKKDDGAGVFNSPQTYYRRVGGDISRSTDFGKLLESFQEAFAVWSDEMATNEQLTFSPYDFSKDLDHFVLFNAERPSSKDIYSTIRKNVALQFSPIPQEGSGMSNTQIFMKIFSLGLWELTANKELFKVRK